MDSQRIFFMTGWPRFCEQ